MNIAIYGSGGAGKEVYDLLQETPEERTKWEEIVFIDDTAPSGEYWGCRRFTFEDPDQDGVNDTYGLGMQGMVATNNVGTLEGFAGAFGVPGHNDTGVFYRDKEGKMTFGWIQPGMKKCLEIARREQPDLVVLQPRSPSCGVKQRYDGTFTGKLVNGAGVTAQLLMENGFRCIDAEDLDKLHESSLIR